MAHVGYTAARLNIFLDIPFWLRSVCQSLHGKDGPRLAMRPRVLEEIQNAESCDPTRIVEEYLSDWWNHERDWQTHPIEVDHLAAFQWHRQKVNDILYFILSLTFIPIGSTVTLKFQRQCLHQCQSPHSTTLANLAHAKIDYTLFLVNSKRQIKLHSPSWIKLKTTGCQLADTSYTSRL